MSSSYTFAMDIVVTPDPRESSRGRIRWRAKLATCALGRSGVVALDTKREGDGATPSGAFLLRRVLWRPDRGPKPITRLPCETIDATDGWCDDPTRAEYNRPVRLPYAGSAESLWRDDSLYNVVVVLGHNDDPPRSDMGSAIFLHVASEDFAPTQGCIAMNEVDLRALLADSGPNDILMIETATPR